MKIIGTGVDIVEIERVRMAARRSPRFLGRVFNNEELEYAASGKKRWERLAVRFAAKEAAWKALGRDGVWLKQIAIRREASGKPALDLRRLKLPKSWRSSLSLSHSDRYAVACCLIYKE